MLVHFPIALLLVSFGIDLAGWMLKRKELHLAGLITLLLGTLGAIGAVITGPEHSRNPLQPIHELFGEITMSLFIAISLLRLFFLWKKSRDIGNHMAYLSAALVGVLLLTYTGHLGGEMVHKPKDNVPTFQGKERGAKENKQDQQNQQSQQNQQNQSNQ